MCVLAESLNFLLVAGCVRGYGRQGRLQICLHITGHGGGRMIILHDTREQTPYTFDRYSDVTVQSASLTTADYTLAGLQDRIGLERKSLADLTGTLTSGRDRFKRECERGKGLDYFALIIEASMEDIRNHNYRSQMTPQSLLQTLAAYSIRYNLHVHWC